MKQILLLILCAQSAIISAQNFTYPKIIGAAITMNGFVPKDWAILDTASGDLNNDGHKDLAMIFQTRDSISLSKNENNYTDTVITQPRILAIAFYDPASKQYKLAEQSNSFILDHDNPNMDEPYQSITISKGILILGFQIFMNAGGWETSLNTYRFRLANKEFILIGADYNSINRGSGITVDHSYNFLTGKVFISTGSIESEKLKVKQRRLQLPILKTLKTFTRPFTWEVEKDFYL